MRGRESGRAMYMPDRQTIAMQPLADIYKNIYYEKNTYRC